jgi:O-antigen/teichoic acid export membrane protein
MRTQNSIKNICFGILSTVVIAILGFLSRKVFIDSLGTEYLGVNGLLTNVLSMLALVESGIGVSIVYCLYKPLADADKPKIIAYIQLYKKAYRIIALIILILSVLMYPFLNFLIKGESIPFLSIVYFLFVAKNVITYYNAHKVSLINADQKSYIIIRIFTVFQVVTIISRILILIVTENYVLYLLVELIIFLVERIFYGTVIDKRYPYINTKEKYFIEVKEKESLIKNVKALFLHNIGTFFVFGTDNILISTFVGIVTVGLYSNYTMIVSQIGSFISPVLGGIGASVGNLIALESNEKSYSVFKISYFVNFWLYSVSVVFLYNLLEPFINWWLGKGYLLDSLTFIFILINFYLTGLRSSILTFKAKAGIFVQDKYMPLLEAAINLAASLILVQYMGLSGIFLGTTISTLSIVFWNVPRLVYKHVFFVPVFYYFTRYMYYVLLTVMACILTKTMSDLLISGDGFISLVAKGTISLLIPNIMYVGIFYKSDEFQELKRIITGVMFRTKLKRQTMEY